MLEVILSSYRSPHLAFIWLLHSSENPKIAKELKKYITYSSPIGYHLYPFSLQRSHLNYFLMLPQALAIHLERIFVVPES
jgi:hypothetical protein